MGDDEVRLVAAGDVEHLGAHFQARGGHGEGAQLEAFGLGQILEDRHRLLARRVVVEEIGDLLALQPAHLLLGELHRGARLRPVAGRDREGVGEALAVGGRRGAEAGRGAEDLVLLELLVERRGLRRAVEAFQHGAFLLEALMRFHGGRHLVLVVDLDDLDLEAFDAALAVDQGDIVLIAGAQHRADRRGRTGAVALKAEHQLLRLGVGLRPAERQGRGRCRNTQPTFNEPRHGFLPFSSNAPLLVGEGPNPEIAPDIPP